MRHATFHLTISFTQVGHTTAHLYTQWAYTNTLHGSSLPPSLPLSLSHIHTHTHRHTHTLAIDLFLSPSTQFGVFILIALAIIAVHCMILLVQSSQHLTKWYTMHINTLIVYFACIIIAKFNSAIVQVCGEYGNCM